MATKKLTALTAGTPEDGDIAYIVKDPTGTPVDRKANVSDFGAVKVATVELTDAQIKTLPTAPVQIVAAPGSGKMIIPLYGITRFAWTADYTNIAAAAFMGFNTSLLLTADQTANSGVSGVLAPGASDMAVFPPIHYAVDATPFHQGAGFGLGTFADYDNLALNFYAFNDAGGNFTGGNAANALAVTVCYIVIDL